MKICEICGQPFEPRSNRQKVCNRSHTKVCPVCGDEFISDTNRSTCSTECKNILISINKKKHIKQVVNHSILRCDDDHVLINSTIPRNKYDNRDISIYYRNRGFQCTHLFPWDDINKIKAEKIPITDDELSIYRLNKTAADKFLDENHLYGTHRGQLLCLGLVKDDEIYQVMTFGKPTHSKSHYVQIYRMCTRLGYSIDGGYQKLSRAASEFGLYNIIAYCDLAKSNVSEYEDIGMKLIRKSPPRLIWSRGDQYINSSLIVSGRSTYHSDEELIQDNWLPIYDCGQSVYEF